MESTGQTQSWTSAYHSDQKSEGKFAEKSCPKSSGFNQENGSKFEISERTLRRVVHDDLGLKSLKRRKVHMLTAAVKQKRLNRSRALLSRATPNVLDRILVSDEKLFTSEQASSTQNDVVLSPSVKEVSENLRFIPRCQKAASVMVWAGISSDSRKDLIFVPAGVK